MLLVRVCKQYFGDAVLYGTFGPLVSLCALFGFSNACLCALFGFSNAFWCSFGAALLSFQHAVMKCATQLKTSRVRGSCYNSLSRCVEDLFLLVNIVKLFML